MSHPFRWAFSLVLVGLLLINGPAAGRDLPEILESGQLRHLGIPYAHFVTGSGDGLDVEVVQLFAAELGLQYVFVETDWSSVYGAATGHTFTRSGDQVKLTGNTPIRGDIIAHGMTVLPWRQQLVDFSAPMFPTQIWVIAPADSPLQPIVPSGNLTQDIAAVQSLVEGLSVMAKPNTCLDPKLYDLEGLGAQVVLHTGSLNHMAGGVLNGMAQTTILDVPDALVALRNFQGHIKVVGPFSEPQHMAAAFAKDAPALREAFDAFLLKLKKDGTYNELVRKYYPGVWNYFPEFFEQGEAIQ
jgi:ABC-type amino acid transport substrate-binding protein